MLSHWNEEKTSRHFLGIILRKKIFTELQKKLSIEANNNIQAENLSDLLPRGRSQHINRRKTVLSKITVRCQKAPWIGAAFGRVKVSFQVRAPICCPNHANAKAAWRGPSSGSGGIANG